MCDHKENDGAVKFDDFEFERMKQKMKIHEAQIEGPFRHPAAYAEPNLAAQADELVHMIEGCQHVILRSVGHAPYIEDSETYNAALRRFLAS